jgi:predicted membrane-bound mannosyltransferase
MLFFIPNRYYVNYLFWMFWVISIMLRYINYLYENLELIVKYDLNIVLMSFIVCCSWDLNCANCD